MDGRNWFYQSYYNNDINNNLNINKINSFYNTFNSKSYDNIKFIFVFNLKHKSLIEEINVDIYKNSIFTPRNVDDDIMSIYLWLSIQNSILYSKHIAFISFPLNVCFFVDGYSKLDQKFHVVL